MPHRKYPFGEDQGSPVETRPRLRTARCSRLLSERSLRRATASKAADGRAPVVIPDPASFAPPRRVTFAAGTRDAIA